MLGHCGLILTHSAEGEFRGLQVRIRYQHDVDLCGVFGFAQPVALLIHEVSRDVHGYLHDNARGPFLTGVFADQAND